MDMFAKKQLHVQHPLHFDNVINVREALRLLSSGRSAEEYVLEVTQDAQVLVKSMDYPIHLFFC